MKTYVGMEIRNVKFTLLPAMKIQRVVKVQLYSFFDLGAICGYVVNATLRPLHPRE
jgi:hypothetical protein